MMPLCNCQEENEHGERAFLQSFMVTDVFFPWKTQVIFFSYTDLLVIWLTVKGLAYNIVLMFVFLLRDRIELATFSIKSILH